MENKRKRFNFSVNSKLQLRLFIKVFGISLVGVGLMAIVFYFYSNREINASLRQFHIHANNFLDLLLPAVSISLVLALLASAVITLFLPLTIAGPLYRIERVLREKVARGDLTVRFHLRKGDEVSNLAEAANICFENLGQKIQAAKSSAERLESLVSGMRETADKNVKDLAIKINENLRQFRVQ